jgi:hypothetical protein
LVSTQSRHQALLSIATKPRWPWLRKRVADPNLRIAGLLWLASKVAIFALAWVAGWIMRPGSRDPLGLGSVWQHWDAKVFRVIAEYGYFGGPEASKPNEAAFFPGYPLLLRGVHVLVPQWTADELIIASVASFFAILGLVLLAEDYQAGSGTWAGVFLLAAPAAVFLSVGYSEAPFLAFALPAWRAARRGSWLWAGLLAACACALRINGLFLVAGMIIMVLLRRNAVGAQNRRWPALAALSISLAPVAAYVIYLYDRTGDWLAWLHAEENGWRRGLHDPVTTFTNTWHIAFGHVARTPFAFAFQLELVAVVVLLITVGVLLWRRHWPEACYTALTAAALVAGHWYMSVPRALLLVFPLWCGLARLALRHRWTAALWLAGSLPLMFATAMLYLDGRWAG